MATIKFILQSKSESAPIYLRLSLGKDNSIKRKIGLNINPKNWSRVTGLPLQNYADEKNLTTELLDLKTFIIKKLNVANSNGVEVAGEWLTAQIDINFNRTEAVDLDYLTNYGRVPLLGLHGGSTIALGSISSEVGIRADLVL